MNWVTLVMGVAMIGFGIATAVLRITHPHLFAKLRPMQERFGQRPGLWIHVIGYTVVPVVLGVLVTINGLRGGSIF